MFQPCSTFALSPRMTSDVSLQVVELAYCTSVSGRQSHVWQQLCLRFDFYDSYLMQSNKLLLQVQKILLHNFNIKF